MCDFVPECSKRLAVLCCCGRSPVLTCICRRKKESTIERNEKTAIKARMHQFYRWPRKINEREERREEKGETETFCSWGGVGKERKVSITLSSIVVCIRIRNVTTRATTEMLRKNT